MDEIVVRAVVGILQRKWWTRLWVVQEVLLSRRTIVQCGEQQVDIVHSVQLLNSEETRGPFLRKDGFEQPSDQPFSGILTDWYAYKKEVESSGLPLLDLTLLTHGFQASVRRDKIFALLGLATPKMRSGIIPDYSDAISDRVFLIRLTACFLQTSLRPLQFARHCRATECPSWVIDWTAIDKRAVELIMHEESYQPYPHTVEQVPCFTITTAKYDPRLEPSIENFPRYQGPFELLVHGKVVDRVKFAVEIPRLHDVTPEDFKTRAESIKVKLREWVAHMMEYLWTNLVWDDLLPSVSRLNLRNERLWQELAESRHLWDPAWKFKPSKLL